MAHGCIQSITKQSFGGAVFASTSVALIVDTLPKDLNVHPRKREHSPKPQSGPYRELKERLSRGLLAYFSEENEDQRAQHEAAPQYKKGTKHSLHPLRLGGVSCQRAGQLMSEAGESFEQRDVHDNRGDGRSLARISLQVLQDNATNHCERYIRRKTDQRHAVRVIVGRYIKKHVPFVLYKLQSIYDASKIGVAGGWVVSTAQVEKIVSIDPHGPRLRPGAHGRHQNQFLKHITPPASYMAAVVGRVQLPGGILRGAR
jgi:hypothetical protein